MEHKIELSFWKKGMKLKCPECNTTVKCNRNLTNPYACKCGAILKPFVKMKT